MKNIKQIESYDLWNLFSYLKKIKVLGLWIGIKAESLGLKNEIPVSAVDPLITLP